MSIRIVDPFDPGANPRLVRGVELDDQDGEAGVTCGRREPPVDAGVDGRMSADKAMSGGHSRGSPARRAGAAGSIVRREKGLVGSQLSVHLHDPCRSDEGLRADAASVGSAAGYRPGMPVGRIVGRDDPGQETGRDIF